jgi:uncharacterized membrane protein YbaN (DUF454 family)
MKDPATLSQPLTVTTPATAESAPAASTAVQGWTRWLWLALAYASLGVGLVAIVVPGLPTTEFILLAAWAASKGSPRLRGWLERHPVFGVMIYNWQHGRVVARRAKLTASLAMSACLVIMLLLVSNRWVVSIAAIGMAIGAVWMWSRPERVSPPPH